jgi:hypothetical protein
MIVIGCRQSVKILKAELAPSRLPKGEDGGTISSHTRAFSYSINFPYAMRANGGAVN